MEKIKVLFLASNPKETSRLSLDEEIREISLKIRTGNYRDSIDLNTAWAVRPDDLIQMLNLHRPQIVHFSGHGTKSAEIILTGNNGEPKPVSCRALKVLFTTLKDNIRVVVLNACYSKEQAEAITQVIDCSIGMNEAIGDDAAITFAASFYRAIGFGCSIKGAFDQGIAALLLEGIPEENTPELLVKSGIDPSQVILLKPLIREENAVDDTLRSRLKNLAAQLNIQTEHLNSFEIERAKYASQMVPRKLEVDIEGTRKEIEKLEREIDHFKKRIA